MYLEKIVCAGLLMFILGVGLNVLTLVTILKHTHDETIMHDANLNIAIEEHNR